MKDRMVILGDTRIRLSNIKNYGISSGTKYRQKIYTRKEVLNPIGMIATIASWLEGGYSTGQETKYEYEWTGEWYEDMSKEELDELDGAVLYKADDGTIKGTRNVTASGSSIQEYQEKYLYITTFQNDNFVIWKSSAPFDIEKKCKEIDEMFNG